MKEETKKLRQRMQTLWPAMKGSLTKVYKPCIRKNCAACACGDKHPAWLLHYSKKGRRSCLYVPEAWVPAVRAALKNGRQIEELLHQMAAATIREYRQNRDDKPPKSAHRGPKS
ncbi:MAG: DUF6788 family protein [Bryobacteraceae bacterium]